MSLSSLIPGLLRPFRDGLSGIMNTVYVLHLFTRSDLKTILIPTTLFGTVAAPANAARYIVPRAIWVWINLLQVDVANQSLRPEEDEINKPWRPIPSNLISQSSAYTLRCALVPLCILLSVALRVPEAGVALAIAIYFYHELDGASHWYTKNLCNAAGYASFNAGASMVLRSTRDAMSKTSLHAQVLNALIIATTIHAQDFQDVEGDAATGRCTFPTAFPAASRLSMLILFPGWSSFLCWYWNAGVVTSVLFVLLACFVGVRFFLNRSTPSKDHATYRVYNIWICCVHVIPFIPRLV